jgi:hypothetical protein
VLLEVKRLLNYPHNKYESANSSLKLVFHIFMKHC